MKNQDKDAARFANLQANNYAIFRFSKETSLFAGTTLVRDAILFSLDKLFGTV